MSRTKPVIPLVDMSISETNVKAVLIDGIFKIRLAGIFASMASPNALVRKGKILVSISDG